MIEKNEIIKCFYDNESLLKKINLNQNERYIKNFNDIGINIAVIEILTTDEIGKDYFLLPMINYIDIFKEFQNEEIETLQYPKGKLSYSIGKIKEINEYEFIHSAETELNSMEYQYF